MNPESLNDLWNSPDNRPEPASGAQLASRFITRLRRRRRLRAVWLVWTSFALTAVSLLAVRQLVRDGLNLLDGQWALLPLLALPWMVLVYFWRAYIREGTVHRDPTRPLRSALLAALTANAAERRNVRLVGGLFALMIPVTSLAVWQIHAVGKVPGHQVGAMALTFGTIFILGALGLLARHRFLLTPERRTLEARLRELDAS